MGNSIITNLTKGVSGYIQKLFTNDFGPYGISGLKLKYLKHLPVGKIDHLPLFGSSFYFGSHLEYLSLVREIFIEQYYQQKLKAKPLIFDCGSNIGMSVLYYKRNWPDATVIAFEPDSKNYKILSKNIASYQLQNVDARNEAVWIEDGEISFEDEGSLSSRIGEGGGCHKVKASRLKTLVEQYDVVDFLKMDIEGAEYKVLMDMDDTIKKINHFFIEYHGTFSQNNELTEIFNLLTRNGFSYYIKEAYEVYPRPFNKEMNRKMLYDIQLNIFCYNNNSK